MYIFYASGIGYGTIAYLIFVFGILQILYRGLAYTVLILGLLFLYYRRRDFVSGLHRLFKNIAEVVERPFSIERAVWLAFILLFIFLNLSIALTPPISKDALIYHLVGPKVFIQDHGIGFVSGNFYTNFPFTIEMLFTLGMLLQGPILAKLIHFSFGFLTVLAIYQWTAGKASVSTGLLAAIIYYTLPLVAKLSGWAYVDMALAFFVLVMTTALLDWKESRHKGLVALAGMLGGLAMGIKYSSLVMVLIIVLSALLFLKRKDLPRDSHMGTTAIKVLAIAAVVAFPWYLKNWMLTGNPVYPFLYSLFGGREWSQEIAKMYALFLSFVGSESGILNYLKLPWDICFFGGGGRPDFDGYIGPIFLLVPILSVAIRPKLVEIRFMLFSSSIYFLLWGALIQQLRLLVPIFPMLSIILALLIHKSPERWRKTRLCILFFCLLTMILNTYFHVDRYRRIAPHQYIAGNQSETEFLRSHLNSYPAIEYINHHLTDQDKVLFVFLCDGPYYCERPYVYDPVFEANTFMDAIRASTSAAGALVRFRQKGITHILLNHDYMASIASILEKRHRGKLSRLLALLSPQACFGKYRLYEVNGRGLKL